MIAMTNSVDLSPLGKTFAYRTDYDLGCHQKASGKPLEYFDEETKTKYLPHVVEPSAGVDRTVLAVLCEAYAEETVKDEESGKEEPRVILTRRNPIQRAHEHSDRAPDILDDIRRIDSEHRLDGLTPTLGRHGVTQAFDMIPDLG